MTTPEITNSLLDVFRRSSEWGIGVASAVFSAMLAVTLITYLFTRDY